MKTCRRPLDPLDAEAIASGAAPVCAPDAAEHARACESCAGLVSTAQALDRALDEFAGRSADEAAEGVDLAAGVIRLRPFSRRERRDFSIWRGACFFAFALLVAGLALLALPGLTAREQMSLSAAAFAPAVAMLRASLRALAEIVSAAPSGLEALAVALRGQAVLGLAVLLLLVPAAWGLRRAVARERR